MSTSVPPAVLALLALACQAPSEPPPAAAPDARMEWWREARFGMFVHWGLYALPAGAWQGHTDYGEWIRDSARIPRDEYARFQGQFDPVRFDPDAWVRLAREAGMKYLVITSKHHDGFGLWDSAETEWDMGGTPSRRDLLGELAAACARGGVRFATYHSIMDWHHPDYLPRRPWETGRTTEGADFERYVDYLHAQVTELITRYRPAVMWFDGEWESTWTHERGVALYELCRSLDPALIVNNRVDVHRGGMAGFSGSSEAVGDFGTPEQEIPATGLPGVDWETCMTMNDHWGWNRADPDWKPVEVLVRNLIDVASKGGNYLLNVGPRADGTFPEQAVERLAGIGRWMAKHGEAIHGTQASPFESLEWGRVTWKRDGPDSVLYLHVFERPMSGRIVLPGLGSEPRSARWLAEGNELPWQREGTDVVVALPGTLPDPIASVVELRVQGEPIVYRAPEILAESDIFVRPLAVRLESRTAGVELRYTLDGSAPTGASPRYAAALELVDSAVVSARAFHRGEPVSATTRREFRRVAPRSGRPPEMVTASGFVFRAYEGDWDRLPDFEALAPVATGSVRETTLDRLPRAEHVGLCFDGLLSVERDDVYAFTLTSDDGSDLWIDGERVIDNDGLHGAEERRGHAALGVGLHAIRVRWFNKTGGAALDLRWAPLGGELAPVRVFVHER
ncbi:MAG TPA: alpha-L-fucosidase [Planctomycetota bacterium]